ncbi:MAG: hypothetical protein JST85_27220 [Acidobacteria bacterium]|nr:hypothetical protein [Acidobacteriota bacterium]
MHKFVLALFVAIASLTLQKEAASQTPLKLSQTISPETTSAPSAVSYRYLFENDKFTTPIQEVEFDGSGRGKFRFKKKDSDEITNDLAVSDTLMARIQSLFDQLNFLSSREEYQHKKDFSHLGTVTISQSRNGKERTVKFNYTENSAMSQLRDIFQNLVTQETRFFEIEVIRETDPISTDAQLRMLDDELHSKRIADPNRFVPLLKDIKLDEGVPLIARNHADRLLKAISKGK